MQMYCIKNIDRLLLIKIGITEIECTQNYFEKGLDLKFKVTKLTLWQKCFFVHSSARRSLDFELSNFVSVNCQRTSIIRDHEIKSEKWY